jgi:hypothetical protein
MISHPSHGEAVEWMGNRGIVGRLRGMDKGLWIKGYR